MKMWNSYFLKILIISFLSFPAFSDPWLSGKDEFKVKKLEYLSIKNNFSIDSSAYPIPLALIRSPNEDMFNQGKKNFSFQLYRRWNLS